jgi:hypothetical protein
MELGLQLRRLLQAPPIQPIRERCEFIHYGKLSAICRAVQMMRELIEQQNDGG